MDKSKSLSVLRAARTFYNDDARWFSGDWGRLASGPPIADARDIREAAAEGDAPACACLATAAVYFASIASPPSEHTTRTDLERDVLFALAHAIDDFFAPGDVGEAQAWEYAVECIADFNDRCDYGVADIRNVLDRALQQVETA